MKTVVENNGDIDKCYLISTEGGYVPIEEFVLEHSCFYDFGVTNPIGFSGFSEGGNSDLINDMMAFFQM